MFVYQPNATTANKPKELSSNFLINNVKQGATLISFPSIYFDGYFPHLQTFNGYVSILNLTHDYFIAYLCSIGFSQNETFNLIQSEDLYTKNTSVNLAERSLKNLRDREEEFSIDAKLSGFIEKNYKKAKLFNQFNHPRRPVFKFLSESILNKIGISNCRIKEKGNSYLDDIITPIYRSTYNNLNLRFIEDFDNYNSVNNNAIKQKDVINEFYNFYKTKNLEEIRNHVFKIKPFIPQLIRDKTNRW